MAEKTNAVPTWVLIVGVVLVIGILVSGYRTVQVQRDLETVQNQLASAQQAADQAKLEVNTLTTQLENSQSRLETMQSEFDSSQKAVVEARTQAESLQNQIAALNVELQNANAQRNELQSEIMRIKSQPVQSSPSENP